MFQSDTASGQILLSLILCTIAACHTPTYNVYTNSLCEISVTHSFAGNAFYGLII